MLRTGSTSGWPIAADLSSAPSAVTPGSQTSSPSPTSKVWVRWVKGIARALVVLICTAALVFLQALHWPDAQLVVAAGQFLAAPTALAGWWTPGGAFNAVAAWLLQTGGVAAWRAASILVPLAAALLFLAPLLRRTRGLALLGSTVLAGFMLTGSMGGFTAWGCAVLMTACWWNSTHARPPASLALLPLLAWLTGWLSPGGPLLAAAAAASQFRRRHLPAWLGAVAASGAALTFTPRGPALWMDAWVFLARSPQASAGLWASGAAVLLAVILGAVATTLGRRGPWHLLLPPLLLLLAALAWGNTALWWPAALFTLPAVAATAGVWSARRQTRLVLWSAGTSAAALAMLVHTITAQTLILRSWTMEARLVLPTRSLQDLPAEGVFTNLSGPALTAAGGRVLQPVVTGQEMARAARDPSHWRSLDRRHRFGAVWLGGPTAEFAPLANHLAESPDWRIAAVDAVGMLFLREPEESWTEDQVLEDAGELESAKEKSLFLAAAARQLLAAGRNEEALHIARQAVDENPDIAEARAALSLAALACGLRQPALEASADAVALRPDLPATWQARLEVLLAAGLAAEAYETSLHLEAMDPGSTGSLWLAVRAANEAKAYSREVELLERLVSALEARGQPTGFYRIFLGQARSRLGQPRQAMEEFDQALASPDLSPRQQAELAAEVAELRRHAPELTPP